jgi:hypothetical protein
MNKTTKIINKIFCLAAFFFLLDNFTAFDIKSQILKSSIYFGFLIGTPIILILNLFSIKYIIGKIIWIVFLIIFIVLIAAIHPTTILLSSSVWRTQTILYQNKDLSFKTIEFQMQDIGARGYNKRLVEVIHVTPLFMLTSDAPNNIANQPQWMKVDKNMNELELK